jgi:hypothetical protein
VVPPDVLELAVPTVSPATVDLDRTVGCLSAQSIGPVVAHADFVAQFRLDLDMIHAIHVGGGLADEKTQHLALGCELDEWELDGLVGCEWLAKWPSLACVCDTLFDAVDSSTERGCCLADAVFVYEGLSNRQSAT